MTAPLSLQLTVSPDFPPEHVAGWYVFNTWLQRTLGLRCHLSLFDDFNSQAPVLAEGRFDLIFAAPACAAQLDIQGYEALVAPLGLWDEAVIAAPAGAQINSLADLVALAMHPEPATDLPRNLAPKLPVAQTGDPAINRLCELMLDSAGAPPTICAASSAASYVGVAKQVLQGRAACGFFSLKALDGLSPSTRRQLRPLATSSSAVLRHLLMAGPQMAPHKLALKTALLQMNPQAGEGNRVLEALGLQGWVAAEASDTGFMFETLRSVLA